MKMPNEPDIEKLIETHLQAINALDPVVQKKKIEGAYLPTVKFFDPFFITHSREELAPIYSSLHEKFPHQTFRRTGPVETHHGAIRMSWALGLSGKKPTHTGQDFILLEEGKIGSVYVFIDGHNYKEENSYENHK